MNIRFKKIRTCNNMSQEEFGKKIGIESRSHISSLENGNRTITDRIVNDVCREFNISEEWLRNGKGEMYNELPVEDEYFKYATQLNNDPLFVAATVTYGKSSPERKQHILEFFRELLNNMNKDI